MKSEGLNGCSRHYQDHMNTFGARSDWNSVERLQRGPGLNPFLAFKSGNSDNNCQGRSPRQRCCHPGFLVHPFASMFSVSHCDWSITKLLEQIWNARQQRFSHRVAQHWQAKTGTVGGIRLSNCKGLSRSQEQGKKQQDMLLSSCAVGHLQPETDENHMPLAFCISRLLPSRDSTNNRWKIFTHMEMSPLNSHFLFLSLFLSNSV